ncbi:MAG: hypothetical protein K6C94_09015 [Candidatus Gastranaerophilales bacterium]|nr:hypothetical protein [Candidatus Gastranaerophilales bacterium]
MFLGMQNDLIALVSDTREKLENTDCMHFTEIVETEDDYALENGSYVKKDKEYFENKFAELKQAKIAENTAKAKEAIENGYVVFKDAQFETNAQTVGDLTATMLMLQNPSPQPSPAEDEGERETVFWLSKDDRIVELTIEDFGILGALIADFKNTVWNEKYLHYKSQIEQAQIIDELASIEIIY